jgi:hypothetical protein
MSHPTDPRQLIGTWALRRRLLDRAAGLSGHAEGTLTIAVDGAALSWHEAAQLHWAGRSVAVTRDLRLAVREGQWWTVFTDHRPFHPWRLDEPVLHPCAADTYRGRLSLDQGGDRLRILWDVTGPAKRQRILTTHRRARAD